MPWLVEPLDAGEPVQASSDLPPLVSEWQNTLSQPETLRAYRRCVRRFLARFDVRADAQLLYIRAQQVRAWRDELAAELDAGRMSHASLKRCLAAVSSLYDYLNHEGHVIVNPVRRVRRPRPPATRSVRAVGKEAAQPPCSFSYCPMSGVGVAAVPDLIGRLARPGGQLTLW